MKKCQFPCSPHIFRLHYSQKLTFANSLICVSYPRFSAFTTIFYKFFRPQQDFSRILQQSRICFTAHFTRVARIARYFAASAAYKDRVLLPSGDCILYRPKLTSSLRLPALTSDRITAHWFYPSYLSHFRIVGFPALRCSLFLIFFLYRPHKKSVPAQRPAPLFIVRHSFRDFRPKARRMIHFQRMTQFVNYNVFYQLVRQYY